MPRPKGSTNSPKTEKKVAGYTDEDFREPRTPVTGHTPLLPADDQVVTLPMDNGWNKAMQVGKLPEGDEGPVAVDMDAAAAPVLFRAGKRNRRQVPVLPIQRQEMIKAPIGTGLGGGSLPGFEPPPGELAMPDIEKRWTGGQILENERQSFRTRQSRDVGLTTAVHTYCSAGRGTGAVKVINNFSSDMMTLAPMNVG